MNLQNSKIKPYLMKEKHRKLHHLCNYNLDQQIKIISILNFIEYSHIQKELSKPIKQNMKTKMYRMSHSIDPIQILSKVKKQMEKQRETQKIQQSLIYLNNSFNNNIQFQEILIDICKAKKDNIRSKQLKTMYTLFSQNKANSLIFKKIINDEQQKSKQQKDSNQTSTKTQTKQTQSKMSFIEDSGLMTKTHSKNNQDQKRQYIRDSSQSQKGSDFSKKHGYRKSITSEYSLKEKTNDESKFLMKRVYCRLMEKILVKIAFYTMNNKYLDFIALNILQLTKSLQTMIRRIENIKDLKLLQQITQKMYRQNFIIENKIYQSLINGGFILSIDEFYRVNGIDIDHKDIYERMFPLEEQKEIVVKKQKLTLKEKISKKKQSKQKQNVVKKDHIDRTNRQINLKYLKCITQIRNIIVEEQEGRKNIKEQQEIEQQNQDLGRNSIKFSKTQPTMNNSLFKKRIQKPSRFSSKLPVQSNFEHKQQNLIQSTVSEQSSHNNSVEIVPKKQRGGPKTFLNYLNRKSTFSSSFTQLIKSTSASKLQRHSLTLSEKLLLFNEQLKKQGNNSIDSGKSSQKTIQGRNSKIKIHNSSEINDYFPINKLLKIYESRNIQRYSVDNFLGPNIRLPHDILQSLKDELEMLREIYGTNLKSQSQNCSAYSSQIMSSKELQERNNPDDATRWEKVCQAQHNVQEVQKSNERFHFRKEQSSNSIDRGQFTNTQQAKNQSQPYNCHNSPKTTEKNKKNNNSFNYKRVLNDQQNKQWSLVKLQKNRPIKIKHRQMISAKNFTIFTMKGVENMCRLKQSVSLKNQQLKKTPYIKIKNKLSLDQLPIYTAQLTPKVALLNADKLADNIHQSLTSQALEKTIQQVLDRQIHTHAQSFIVKKNHNSHNRYNKTMVCFKNNIVDEKYDTSNQLSSLNSDFIQQVGNFEPQQKSFQRSTKPNSTYHRTISSQPSSPIASPNKQNSLNGFYQVYDIRKKRRF